MNKNKTEIAADIVANKAQKAADQLIEDIHVINSRFVKLETGFEDINFRPNYKDLKFNLSSTFVKLLARKNVITPR